MANIYDEESRCLELRILSRQQIEDIRSFFCNILKPDRTQLNFDDFSQFIMQLSGLTHLDGIVMQQFFRLFDRNGDGQLDWNEYLQQFVSFSRPYIPALKMLSEMKDRKRYLDLLQTEHLIQPFTQNYTLNQVQMQLLQIELQIPSVYHIKGCYFEACCDYSAERGLKAQPGALNYQLIYNTLYDTTSNLEMLLQLNELFSHFIYQRAPHQVAAIASYWVPVVQAFLSDNFVEPMLSFLTYSQQDYVLSTLKHLTFLCYGAHNFKITADTLDVLGEYLDRLFDSPDQLIQYQSLLCLGHLLIWKPQLIEKQIIEKRLFKILQLDTASDPQRLMYQSWVISIFMGRYEQAGFLEFVTRANNPATQEIYQEWLNRLHEYIKKIMETYRLTESTQMGVQTLLNLFHIISPLVCAPNPHQYLWELIIQGLELPNESINPFVRLIIIVLTKRIFIIPYHQSFQNVNIQNYMVGRGIIRTLMDRVVQYNQYVSEKALKLLFNTLCGKHTLLISNSLLASQTQHQFLQLCMELYGQLNTNLSSYQYKLYFWTGILNLANHDGSIFQMLAAEQIIFNQLTSLMDITHRTPDQQLAIFANVEPFYKLTVDHTIWNLIHFNMELFGKHFQYIFFDLNKGDEQVFQIIKQLMPNQNVLDIIQGYMQHFFSKMSSFRPLLNRKYNQGVYRLILNILFTIGQFLTQLLDFSIRWKDPIKINLQVQGLIDKALQLYELYLSKQSEIENLMILVGSQLSTDGNVVTVFLNHQNSDQSCKIVIKKNMKLIEFEKYVEQGLKNLRPFLYLVINQSDPNKIKSVMDQTITGEEMFQQFLNFAFTSYDSPNGPVLRPQEMIAVDIFKLKFIDGYSLQKIFKIIRAGNQYIELNTLKQHSLIWQLDGSATIPNFQNEDNIVNALYQISNLNIYQIQAVHRHLIKFFDRRNKRLDNYEISAVEFVDFLSEQEVPFRVGKTIQLFISKQGLNAPVDYRDFICFLTIISDTTESLILKFVYLSYVNDHGAFGQQEIELYLKDMVAIQKREVNEIQIREWTKDLLQRVDNNKDQYISFNEFQSLLTDPRYKERLLDPLESLLKSLMQQRQSDVFRRHDNRDNFFRGRNYQAWDFNQNPKRNIFYK